MSYEFNLRPKSKTPFIFRLVPIFIGFTFALLVAWWAIIGYATYYAIQQGPAYYGEKVGEFMRGVEQGQKK